MGVTNWKISDKTKTQKNPTVFKTITVNRYPTPYMRAASLALSKFPLCLSHGQQNQTFRHRFCIPDKHFTIVNLRFARADAMTTGAGAGEISVQSSNGAKAPRHSFCPSL